MNIHPSRGSTLEKFKEEGWTERPRSNPRAQQVFIKTDFRFGFHALLKIQAALHKRVVFTPVNIMV